MWLKNCDSNIVIRNFEEFCKNRGFFKNVDHIVIQFYKEQLESEFF